MKDIKVNEVKSLNVDKMEMGMDLMRKVKEDLKENKFIEWDKLIEI